MTTPQYPGYPDDGSQSGGVPQGAGAPDYAAQPGYDPQAGGASGYGAGPDPRQQPGYGPQPGMSAGGGMPPYPPGAMGGVPLSVGDGMSWAWSKFKENALILVVGMGLWTVLSSFTIEAHYNINGEEHGFGLVGPSGTYIAFAIGLFASIVTTHMAIKVATGRPLAWGDLFTFPNFGASLLAAFLTWLATSVGSFLCVVPGIIAAFLFHYSVYFTVDKGMDGIAGMKASWATLSSHVGELFPFALTGAGLYLVGVLTVFGWLVTVPLVMLLSAYSYVRIQGYDVVR
ncbi:hypothetical protein [Actinomyces oris]|mgnify:FL=1|nr:hypothetical protein [Actinomyces oris]